MLGHYKLVDVKYSYKGIVGTPMIVYGVDYQWAVNFIHRMCKAGHHAHIMGEDDYASITAPSTAR